MLYFSLPVVSVWQTVAVVKTLVNAPEILSLIQFRQTCTAKTNDNLYREGDELNKLEYQRTAELGN